MPTSFPNYDRDYRTRVPLPASAALSCAAMEAAEISRLLEPFLPLPGLTAAQLEYISMYIDMLLRWNRTINLTAVRRPEEIVTRHFGESLFAARHLLAEPTRRVSDVGSGAGFPGLPLKIHTPAIHLTLIESHQRKAAFLREVIRALNLTDAEVFAGRAEDFTGGADLVTMRAVEKFERVLPAAAKLVPPGGRVALLIGATQVEQARLGLRDFSCGTPLPIPGSTGRVLLIARNHGR